MLIRRNFLKLGLGTIATGLMPQVVFANANTEKRFIFIIQRGANDGLNTLIPYADPEYAKLRGEIAIPMSEANKLDGMFALHPALKTVHELYKTQNASFIHAIASPYRERSHFDGQNILETGGARAYENDSGWLNRLIGIMPNKSEAIAISPTIPSALRGSQPVTSYAPSNLPEANEDLLMRLNGLYENDPKLYEIWLKAQATNEQAGDQNKKQSPEAIGKMVSEFLNNPKGPRIAMIETGGWDTHSGQLGRHKNSLTQLDTLISSLKTNLDKNWDNTTILVATEFGRTAAVNGTGGTDHGTASCAMVLGGNVKKGKIIADWPGLKKSDLYEGRDLKATNNINGLIAGLCSQIYGLDPDLVARTLFPTIKPQSLIQNLI